MWSAELPHVPFLVGSIAASLAQLEATIYNAFRGRTSARPAEQRPPARPFASTAAPAPTAARPDGDSARGVAFFNGEKLLTFKQALARFPKRPHLSTLHRWVTDGANDVRLETVRVGRARYITQEAIDRFIAGQSEQQQQQPEPPPPTKQQRGTNRSLDRAASNERLKKRLGIEPGAPKPNSDEAGFRGFKENLSPDQRGSAFDRHRDGQQKDRNGGRHE